jgi:hypothetical protein
MRTLTDSMVYLVMLFVVILLSARHYGDRFVANILVETSIKQPY